jgi:hypothetical protein
MMARKAGEDNNESSLKQRWLAKLDNAVLYELQMRPKYIDKDLTALVQNADAIHQLKRKHHQLACQNATVTTKQNQVTTTGTPDRWTAMKTAYGTPANTARARV